LVSMVDTLHRRCRAWLCDVLTQQSDEPHFHCQAKLFNSNPVINRTNRSADTDKENILHLGHLLTVYAGVLNARKVMDNRGCWLCYHLISK
jgi:hypothetical protein